MIRIFLVIAFLVSCSTPGPKICLVDDFMKERIENEYAQEKPYEDAYSEYLKKVELFYFEEGIEHKFTSYLGSIRNKNELLAHADFNFPARYKRERGFRGVPGSKNYEAYKERFMQYLESKIDKERVERLRSELGEAHFNKLKTLHSGYIAHVHRYKFPI